MESASITARMVAAFRGRASTRPDTICHDPWASALAGPEGEQLADSFEATFAAMELWMAVRTAYIDLQLEQFVGAGKPIQQVVILGAGCDTRAARLNLERAQFFEVDTPVQTKACSVSWHYFLVHSFWCFNASIC